MNKKTLFLFLIILFVLPMFVSANPFWDLITGNAVSNTRPTAQITTSSLGYGKQVITATVSDSNGDLQSAYISIKSSYFSYLDRPMNCKGTGYKKECTYSVDVSRSEDNRVGVYVKGRDRYGYGRSAYKFIRINPTTITTSKCQDSDGGKVYTSKGTVTFNGVKYVDYCYSSKVLREYYCSNNNVKYVYHPCSKCVNGACIETPPTCKDSDGGINIYVKGSVSSSAGVQTDYCSGNSLIEYYCSGNDVAKSTNYCKFGCGNGACFLRAPPSCKDSDGGKVYTSKGTVVYDGRNYADFCYSPTHLTEYYCYNDIKRYTFHKCSKCVNGACVENPPPTSKCQDSDDGKVYISKGTVTINGVKYVDSCYSSKVLREYYCYNNNVKYVYHPCSKCVNGACVGTPPSTSTCQDSDGGKVYTVKGTVTVNGGKYVDYCYSSTALKEHYCSNNNVRYVYHTCSKCVNGACIETPPVETPPSTSKCQDSDGGKVYTSKGTVTINGLKYVDYCHSSKGLWEYYCSNNNVRNVYHSCSKCVNGACIETPPVETPPSTSKCQDSDDGKNYFVKGSVDSRNGNYVTHSTDYCSGKYLIEYYCSDKGAAKETHFCKDGCYNGACKKVNYECKAGEWKCDSNWPKYAYGCDDGKWLNTGMVPPAPSNGKWYCNRNNWQLTIVSGNNDNGPNPKLIKEGNTCYYNNNPWKCNDASWPGSAYFCVNHKWVKLGIPLAPQSAEYKCENGDVKIVNHNWVMLGIPSAH